MSSYTLDSEWQQLASGMGGMEGAPHRSLVPRSVTLPSSSQMGRSSREPWGGAGDLPEQSAPNPQAGPQAGDGGCRARELRDTCSQSPASLGQPSAAPGL